MRPEGAVLRVAPRLPVLLRKPAHGGRATEGRRRTGRERLVEQRDQSRRLYELARDGYAELEREVERLRDEVHGYKMERDQAWQVKGLLREQPEAALAGRDHMKQAEQQVNDTFLASENERLRAERDEARRLARWLYNAGGQEALDVNGASDVSEWPWLLEDQ